MHAHATVHHGCQPTDALVAAVGRWPGQDDRRATQKQAAWSCKAIQ